MYIDVLGTPYNIKFQTYKENNKLKITGAKGLCEEYSKEIIIQTGYEDDPECYDNITEFRAKNLRHELFHALFHESGLQSYSEDEQLVDFLALQYPKIEKIMHKAEEIHKEVMNYKETE